MVTIMNYLDYCIEANNSVKDAMKKLDKIMPHILFITEKSILRASLTDGDIRRYLLRGGTLGDNVINAGNKNPRIAMDLQEAKDFYHEHNFVAIPIVDYDYRLKDIYIGEKIKYIFYNKLNLPVVINAGGKGTRLAPYTNILPKPLIPVGELPILEHIMQQFNNYECNRFHIIVNYKKEIMKAYFSECDKDYTISWYDETKPLGTGGGLCYLKGKLSSTFFFTNCDNLLLSNYDSIIRFHKENHNVITMICAYKNLQIPYGVIEMGVNGSIEDMKEKPEYSFLTNTGIYVVEPEVINDIDFEEAISFPDIIEREIAKGKKVAIYPVSENDWLDMGQMSELEKMRKRLYGE